MLLSSRSISTHEEHLALKDIPSYFVTQFLNGPEGFRKENFVPSQHFLPPRRISLLPLSQTQWTACPALVLKCSTAMTPAGLLPVLRLVDTPPSLMPSLKASVPGTHSAARWPFISHPWSIVSYLLGEESDLMVSVVWGRSADSCWPNLAVTLKSS